MKCLDYALELAPVAADGYFRRSQCRMYNQLSTIAELRLAVDDANKAIERRPKDKLYQRHRAALEQTVKNKIAKEVLFVTKLVRKAQQQLEVRERINHIRQLKRQEQEEEKGEHVHSSTCGHSGGSEKELELAYPEECRVLDIMRSKYHEAVRFFTDTNDKPQQKLATAEFQRFAYFYHEKMARYLAFDPLHIEDDVYSRLDEEVRVALADPAVVRQVLIICNRKGQQILEDEEVNTLNFQMFQYAMKIF
jgi:hypothetical protein